MKLTQLLAKVSNKLEWKIINPLLAKSRQKKLKCLNFTIISNNCWAGRCYDYFGLPKLTPTVGAYFFAEDYVRFCKNLKYYLQQELVLIDSRESNHYQSLVEKGEAEAIVGRLDDVEIVFLHYHDKDVLLQKWQRRLQRICWENVVLKFSFQNDCTDALVEEFLNIDEYPKFCLVGEKITGHKDEILYNRHQGKETVNETENFSRFIDPLVIMNERLR